MAVFMPTGTEARLVGAVTAEQLIAASR
jgi:hypothetical protein